MRTQGYYWCRDGKTWQIFFWDGSLFRGHFYNIIESAVEEINEERIPEPKHKAA